MYGFTYINWKLGQINHDSRCQSRGHFFGWYEGVTNTKIKGDF